MIRATDSTPMGLMVERSLAQTARAGLTYAVIPKPWMVDWFRDGFIEHRFEWYRYCGHKEHGWDTDKFPIVDGDVYVCLIVVHVCEQEPNPHHVGHDVAPRPHDGPCGYHRIINPSATRSGPVAEGFESVITYPGDGYRAHHS